MEKYLCFRCQHELHIDDNWMGSDIGAVAEEKLLTDDDFHGDVDVMPALWCEL